MSEYVKASAAPERHKAAGFYFRKNMEGLNLKLDLPAKLSSLFSLKSLLFTAAALFPVGTGGFRFFYSLYFYRRKQGKTGEKNACYSLFRRKNGGLKIWIQAGCQQKYFIIFTSKLQLMTKAICRKMGCGSEGRIFRKRVQRFLSQCFESFHYS